MSQNNQERERQQRERERSRERAIGNPAAKSREGSREREASKEREGSRERENGAERGREREKGGGGGGGEKQPRTNGTNNHAGSNGTNHSSQDQRRNSVELDKNQKSPPPPSQQPSKLVEEDLFTQIGSFFKNLIFSETPEIPATPPTSPTNWQANYLSPVHTKLKKEGRIAMPEKDKDKGVEWLLKNHFKGILPYYRVWEIKMEEMDADTPTMGKGTPPFPNRPIFKREMIATKLFLKDYGKRRGLTSTTNRITEEEVEVKALRKNGKEERSLSFSFRTQSLAPVQIKRRRSEPTHRPSKLVS